MSKVDVINIPYAFINTFQKQIEFNKPRHVSTITKIIRRFVIKVAVFQTF